MSRPETYGDIVWKQFRKDHLAFYSLWFLGPMFLLAITAPLVASDRPFVYFDGESYAYPWFNKLFHPDGDDGVQYVFNMALLGMPIWTLAAVGIAIYGRLHDWRVRWMFGAGIVTCLAVTLVLSGIFLIEGVAPDDKFFTDNFPVAEFKSQGKARGWYAPLRFGPYEQDLEAIYRPPLFLKEQSKWRRINDADRHWLGTDNTGRDVLVLLIYGTRIAMTIGFVAAGMYLTIGVILGAFAGYFGGWVDILISRAIEVVMLFPAFFLILAIVGMMGPSIMLIMLVIGLTSWPGIARLVRGEVLKQRAQDYAVGARALGASHMRVLFRHVLPNSLTPVLVALPFSVAGAITTEAGLSLLGFGVRPPAPTWGTILSLGQKDYAYYWLLIAPSLAIFFTVAIFNFVGSGLRDAMDPKLRR